MKDMFISLGILFAVVFGIFYGLFQYTEHLDRQELTKLTAECKKRFGQEWEGRLSYRSPDYCVNLQGEDKYL